jgi:hypothetical protein
LISIITSDLGDGAQVGVLPAEQQQQMAAAVYRLLLQQQQQQMAPMNTPPGGTGRSGGRLLIRGLWKGERGIVSRKN